MLRLLPLLTLALIASCKAIPGATPDQKRAEIDALSERTLDGLYREVPSARGHVQGAAGYGVFTNYGTKIFLLSAGNGYGQVTDNVSGKRTYMRAAELGVGLGAGLRDFSLVFVFDTHSALDTFVREGWNLGGSADAAATYEGEGASLSEGVTVAPGVHLYQMTDSGLALSATVNGTRYWPDDELN